MFHHKILKLDAGSDKKKKIKNIRNIRIHGGSEMRIGRIQELNRRPAPPKKRIFSEKKKLEGGQERKDCR